MSAESTGNSSQDEYMIVPKPGATPTSTTPAEDSDSPLTSQQEVDPVDEYMVSTPNKPGEVIQLFPARDKASPATLYPEVKLTWLEALFADCDGLVEVRALPSRQRAFFAPGDTAGLATWVEAHQHENVYFGVATRINRSSGTLQNCRYLGALFADLDFKASSEDAARARLAAFPLQPSLVIKSGGGLHAYWVLSGLLNLSRDAAYTKALLQRLADAVGGDPASAEPAHILRVPGTSNWKYDPPRAVTVEALTEVRYSPEQLEAALPPVSAAGKQSKKKTPLSKVKPTERNVRLFSFGRTMRRQGMDEVAIGAAIMQANDALEVPMESAEVERIIASVIRLPDEAGWPAPATEWPAAKGEEDLGGERFTDRENARLLEALSVGEVRHADEMAEKWYQTAPLRWLLDFKQAVVPYVQRVVQYYFTCRDQECAATVEKKAQVQQVKEQGTNEDEKGAAT